MRLCFLEDAGVQQLAPLTLTRPAFALRCGASTILQRQSRSWRPEEVGALVRPYLVPSCRQTHPALRVNDAAWLSAGPTVYVNARWLPAADASLAHNAEKACFGLVGDQVVFVSAPPRPPEGFAEAQIASWLEWCRDNLPRVDAGGIIFDYLWDVVAHNPQALIEDARWFQEKQGPPPQGIGVLGPAEQALVAEEAEVEPFVTLDTRGGPVLIDRGARIHSFSRLEGPCYVGRDSWIVGAQIRAGTTIGPCCRIGGEVEASIVQGFSNKYHDGFLGHSYLGEWINLAAGTQTSDLRNDYGLVRVWVGGRVINTGQTKVGSFIGDHTKTGLGALLNTGSHIGAFANVLSGGGLLPRVVPSFCEVVQGQVQERRDLRAVLAGAAKVMPRRGQEMTAVHRDLYYDVYDLTASLRHQTLRDADLHRWRRGLPDGFPRPFRSG